MKSKFIHHASEVAYRPAWELDVSGLLLRKYYWRPYSGTKRVVVLVSGCDVSVGTTSNAPRSGRFIGCTLGKQRTTCMILK